jgi:hypothetical protein
VGHPLPLKTQPAVDGGFDFVQNGKIFRLHGGWQIDLAMLLMKRRHLIPGFAIAFGVVGRVHHDSLHFC